MNICVFLSAYDESGRLAPYVEELGNLIAKGGHTLVWGGSNRGLMKILADSAEGAGGKIIGITAELFKDYAREKSHEMTIAKTVSERKALMLARSDAFIILSGGLGTLDELTEIMESKKIHLHEKPIIILNLDGFYDGLKMQLERIDQDGFSPRPIPELVRFVETPKEAMQCL